MPRRATQAAAVKKPRSGRSKKSAGGDCYEAAAKFMLDGMLKSGKGPDASVMEGFIVVHAEVMGQGPLAGTPFGHGFVVDTTTDLVIDQSNGRDLRLPRMFYYAMGQIEDIGNYHEYTPEEVLENLRKYKHYGPWDLKTSSGL
jgi:hypothetical protein